MARPDLRVDDHESLVPFTVDRLRELGETYAGEHLDDPVLCPLDAGLRGLPPLLIQTGLGDALSVDAQRFAQRAQEQDADVLLEEYDADAHDFHVFWSFLPEAANAMARAGEFIQAQSGPRAD